MKRFIYIIIASLAVSLTGCQKDIISDIEGSADDRINKVITEWETTMLDSEYGWFANIMTEKGIYRFWVKFLENHEVEMYTDNLMYPELNGVGKTSTYRLEQYQRPTLIFDTYNYIHIINDPNNSISGGNRNQGLVTDFEFEIVGYASDVFYMEGRINNVSAALQKCSEAEYNAVKAGRLMDQLNEVTKYAAGKTLQFKIGDTDISVILKERSFTTIYKVDDEFEVQKNTIYASMANGDLIFPGFPTINGVTFALVKWDEENKTYNNVVGTNGELYPLEAVAEPSFSLADVFGLEKVFGKLRYYYDADFLALLGSSSSNPIYKGMKGDSLTTAMFLGGSGLNLMNELFTSGGGIVRYVDFYFDYNDDGGLKMVISVGFELEGSVIPLDYYYNVTLDPDDASKFTVDTKLTYSQYGEMFYEQQDFLQGLLGYMRPCRYLVDAFAGKTFTIQWSDKKYKTELVGELYSEDGTYFLGAIGE